MKKILFVAVVAMFVMSMAGGAFAATQVLQNNNIGVTGNVQAKCTQVSGGAFPLLAIDPTPGATSVAAASTDEVVRCTNKQTYTIMIKDTNSAVNAACNNDGIGVYGLKLHAGAADADIPFTFKCSDAAVSATGTFAGQGFGTDIPMGLSVSVVAADALAASFGASYADTVTLTIQY